MVDVQIASRGIRNKRVLLSMRQIPREIFLERRFAEAAYEDGAVPIPKGQASLSPTSSPKCHMTMFPMRLIKEPQLGAIAAAEQMRAGPCCRTARAERRARQEATRIGTVLLGTRGARLRGRPIK